MIQKVPFYVIPTNWAGLDTGRLLDLYRQHRDGLMRFTSSNVLRMVLSKRNIEAVVSGAKPIQKGTKYLTFFVEPFNQYEYVIVHHKRVPRDLDTYVLARRNTAVENPSYAAIYEAGSEYDCKLIYHSKYRLDTDITHF